MGIQVTNPVTARPKKPRHVSAVPHAPRPKVTHVRAPKPPHAPRVTHARIGKKMNLSPAEIATGQQDNANEAAALGGGYAGTAAQVTNPGGGTPWKGAYDKYGMPTGTGSGRTGLRVVDHHFASLAAYTKSIQGTMEKQGAAGGITYFTAHQRSVYASTHSLSAAIAAGPAGTHTATPHVPVVHAAKVTAPLQLSDSGLLGHDSHTFNPPALTAVAPVTTRHPGH
jgi:hypothetical protein